MRLQNSVNAPPQFLAEKSGNAQKDTLNYRDKGIKRNWNKGMS